MPGAARDGATQRVMLMALTAVSPSTIAGNLSGYVVNRPFRDSNVGSNLSSLVGAAWVANRLERELIVDWRGMSQLRDPSINYASEFFALPDRMLGVPVHSAPFLDAQYEEGSPDARWVSPAEARTLAGHDDGSLPRFLVLETYHGLDRVHPGPEATRFRLLRAAFRAVGPSPRIGQVVEEWTKANLEAGFVIGVNVRTGNGAYFKKGMRYADRVDISLFESPRRFLRLLERACRSRLRGLPRLLRDDFQIFYATDSSEMSELLGQLPNAVTRRLAFPPSGAGDLYAFGNNGYSDRDAVDDTVADMFLLARCDALVYNTSLFNQYARVVTGYFGGNHAHFESLVLRKRIEMIARAARRRLA
jgi:Nodulation protein Z (NodZ)